MKAKTKTVVYGAIIAAMYTMLTVFVSAFGLANGAIQVRISEALTILPYFTPYAIPGLFAGCLISNIITGCVIWDTIFGSIATLIGAVITYYLGRLPFKNSKWLAPLGPIAANTAIIPIILSKVYGAKEAIWFLCVTIGIGEVLSCGVLGMILLVSLEKHADRIFK